MLFETIHTSNSPIDCHIIKGRLSSHGIDCFLYDENIVWVNPYKSVSVGGVKLKVPTEQFKKAAEILNSLTNGILCDEIGEYPVSDAFFTEFSRQDEVLRIKSVLRSNPSLIETPEIESDILSKEEMNTLLNEEHEYIRLSQDTLNFKLKDFINNFFDSDPSTINPLRIRPVEYYLEKDLIDNYSVVKSVDSDLTCPYCASRNVRYDYAIDYKWDFVFLILCTVTLMALPPMRKNCHCFDCGMSFRKKMAAANKVHSARGGSPSK